MTSKSLGVMNNEVIYMSIGTSIGSGIGRVDCHRRKLRTVKNQLREMQLIFLLTPDVFPRIMLSPL